MRFFSPRRSSPRSWLGVLAIAVLATGRLSAQNLFSGVWEPGTDGHGLWVTSDWDDFTEQWDAWNESGLRLDDFEVAFEGDTPVYIGSFRGGSGGHAAWIVPDWNDFTAQWAAFERQGLRMHDFETYVVDGTRWYAGIFREGTGGSAAWVVSDWGNFTSKWDEFTKAGLRMHDFETYVERGTRWYAGIFREGTGGHAAWFTDDWNSFTSKWDELDGQGLRLVDFEMFQDGSTTTYGGIFRPGTGGHYGWFGVDWQNFVSFWNERGKEGYRLADIEVQSTACSNVCMNQLVMPTGYYDYGITGTGDHCEDLPGTCPANPDPWVYYRAPFYEEGGQRYARLSAVMIPEPIFTLPFTATDITHNGWLYSPGEWHHAIDYGNGDNFDVRAAAPGRVIHVGWDTWSGNTVVISHEAAGEEDRYRTIYMHLLNGAENDCANAWSLTMPTLSASQKNIYDDYLAVTSCNQNGSGTPDSTRWGTNADTIPVSVGDFVARGQKIGKAGSTGPGGCGCMSGGDGPNHHLHIFFAHRDPTDNRWYFFDPYGIYGPTECYPTRDDADGASSATPCARYPVAWLGGYPQLPSPSVAPKIFFRGDVNGDGENNISDPIALLGCKFLGSICPECDDAADANDDGAVDIADAIFSLTCLFVRPCRDFGVDRCDADASTDRLGCRRYLPCEERR